MNKFFIFCFLALAVTGANAMSLFNKNSRAAEAANAAAAQALAAANPEEQVRRLIEKCTVPTTDGVCECVANAVLANLTQDQWKIVNKYVFDTRRNISLTDFLIANPWIIPKIMTPYLRCS